MANNPAGTKLGQVRQVNVLLALYFNRGKAGVSPIIGTEGGAPPQTGLSAQQNSDTVGTKDLPQDTRYVVKSQSTCDVHTFLSGLRGAAITAGMKRYPSYSRLL